MPGEQSGEENPHPRHKPNHQAEACQGQGASLTHLLPLSPAHRTASLGMETGRAPNSSVLLLVIHARG